MSICEVPLLDGSPALVRHAHVLALQVSRYVRLTDTYEVMVWLVGWWCGLTGVCFDVVGGVGWCVEFYSLVSGGWW